jgi:hypothetical protein
VTLTVIAIGMGSPLPLDSSSRPSTNVTVGIDLAKNVFAIHGVDEAGKAMLVKPKVSRDQLVPLIAQLPPCLIGMETYSGAHDWARLFRQHGHTVKLMSPRLVAPYRMSCCFVVGCFAGSSNLAAQISLGLMMRFLLPPMKVVSTLKRSCQSAF